MRLYPATNFKAVHFGEHKINDEECGRLSLGIRNEICCPIRTVNSEAAGLQVVCDQARDVVIVLHQDDQFREVWSRFPWLFDWIHAS